MLDHLKHRVHPRQAFADLFHGTTARRNNGTLTVVATNDRRRELLAARWRDTVASVAARVYGESLTVVFVVGEPAPPPVVEPPPVADVTTEATEAAGPWSLETWVTSTSFNPARLGGYTPISHYASYFWQPLLGDAFILWKRLEADTRIDYDARDITKSQNHWSPAMRFYYNEMARMINRTHPRVVKGGAVECWETLKARRDGRPLATCCGREDHQPTAAKTTADGCVRCMRWQTGLLETLHRERLVAIEETKGRARANELQIQVWRVLPLLTPSQVSQLDETLQAEHTRWLDGLTRSGDERRPDLAASLTLTLDEWRSIEADSLVPLMPGHGDATLRGEFRPDREFLLHACHKQPGEKFF